MANKNMKYIVISPDGKEYGPVDQETLIQWSQSGRITEQYLVRNALMKKGNPPSKIPFLKDIIEKQKNLRDRNRPLSTKLSHLVDSETESHQAGLSLNQSNKNVFSPGPSSLRFLAWLIDTSLLLAFGIGTLLLASKALESSEAEYGIFLILTLAYFTAILMYYTVSIGFTAQTLGQRFAGLMAIRTKGGPVLMGRAFVFSVFYLVFFWTTLPFTFCLPSKRAIQDKLSGIRIVKITAG